MKAAPVTKDGPQRELVLGFATLAIAAVYYLMALRIPQSDIADVIGAQGLPRTYAALLAGLSIILIVRAVVAIIASPTRTQRVRAAESPVREVRAASSVGEVRAASSVGEVRAASPVREASSPVREIQNIPRNVGWRVFGMLMNGVIYVLVVPWLGYILSIAALIAATVYYQGGGLNRRVAAVAVGSAFALWLLFVRLLHIAHPAGIWPSLL